MNVGLRKDIIIVLLFVALCCAIAGHSPAKQAEIEDTMALKHDADFSACRMIQPPPLVPPANKYQLIPGQPPKDKGFA